MFEEKAKQYVLFKSLVTFRKLTVNLDKIVIFYFSSNVSTSNFLLNSISILDTAKIFKRTKFNYNSSSLGNRLQAHAIKKKLLDSENISIKFLDFVVIASGQPVNVSCAHQRFDEFHLYSNA